MTPQMRPGYGGKHVVRCGVWCDAVWCGVRCDVWCGVVWCGVVRCDAVCGVVCGMRCGVWYALGDINRAEETADETGGTVVST